MPAHQFILPVPRQPLDSRPRRPIIIEDSEDEDEDEVVVLLTQSVPTSSTRVASRLGSTAVASSTRPASGNNSPSAPDAGAGREAVMVLTDSEEEEDAERNEEKDEEGKQESGEDVEEEEEEGRGDNEGESEEKEKEEGEERVEPRGDDGEVAASITQPSSNSEEGQGSTDAYANLDEHDSIELVPASDGANDHSSNAKQLPGRTASSGTPTKKRKLSGRQNKGRRRKDPDEPETSTDSDTDPDALSIMRSSNNRNRVITSPDNSEDEHFSPGTQPHQHSNRLLTSPAGSPTPLFLPASSPAPSSSPPPPELSDDSANNSRSSWPPAKRPRRRRLVRRRPTPEPESASDTESEVASLPPPLRKARRRYDPDDSSDTESGNEQSEASESDDDISESDMTEMDGEDRDDLSSTVDSDAEREVDDGEEVLEVGVEDDERIIYKRAPPSPPQRKRADGQILNGISSEQDLKYSDKHEPPASDTDDGDSDDYAEEDDYPEGENEDDDLSKRERRKQVSTKKRDRAPSASSSSDTPVHGYPDLANVARAMRKRRKQMDDINFQRLCITLAVRYRNGASHSNKALDFLDQQYFVKPWQWLNGKMQYAAGCLERATWTIVKHDYKDYSEYTQNPISFSEHCEGCYKDHEQRCNSYTDIRMTGGYEPLTLTPMDRPPITVALGTNCRTSFVESFEVYHQVYKTAMEFERDIFDRKHMFVAVKRILHKDIIDIDELVAFLKSKGTDRRVWQSAKVYSANIQRLDERVMKTIHRTYDKIKQRRLEWWQEREAFSAFQRNDVYWRIESLKQTWQGLGRVRGHRVGPIYHDD